mgnify:CR=1 FL=1
MTTKTVDEWTAEQCGFCIMTGLDDKEYFYRPNTTEPPYDFEWTIKDPRCREIVREHFKIDTREYYAGGWQSIAEDIHPPIGKTIAEAEIACIQVIYEASQ